MTWAFERLGCVQDQTTLELGPLEGGHSYMLENAGAEPVVALENNINAFLRRLIVKEILGLEKVRFLRGDFRPFLASNGRQFGCHLRQWRPLSHDGPCPPLV